MKKLLGLRSLAAVAVAAAAVGSIAGGFSATAGAAGLTPPWESTGSNYGSVGGLLFFNASGQQVTGGNLTDTPIAAYVEGTSTVRTGDTKATLYAYTPVNSVAPGNWRGESLSASTSFPNASAPAPLNTATLPVVTGGALDEDLSQYIVDYPNNDTSSDGYAGLYQLRLKTTAPGQGGNTTYDSADIEVSGSTWSVVYPTQATTTSVTASPSGSAAFGSSVQLTATVSPSAATGTVQFLNGTAAIGSPVTVSGGSASLTTSAIGAGNDNIYAVYTPDATSSGNGYGPSSGSTPLTVTATTTTLTTNPATKAASGASVQLNATVGVYPATSPAASGTVQFEDGTTPIGSPVTVSSGAASTTTTTLPAGSLTLNAVFTSANSAEGNSTGSATLAVTAAPVITSATSTTFAPGAPGSFQVTASGYPASTFSETGSLPTGVSLSTAGLLSGTPTQSGTFPITITATNGISPAAIQNFTLDVNSAPTFTSTSSTTFAPGVNGSFQVTATGSPAPTFSETGALPAGVTLSSAGLLSGTPTGSGCGPTVYPIDLLATNGVGPGASQSFTLTVGASTAFAVCAPANLTATPGTPYSGTFTVANAGGVDQTGATKVTWSATGVPEGFKFKKGILEDTSGKKMVAGTYSVDVTAVENYKVESTATVNGKTKTVKTPETATASLTVTLVVS